MKDGFLFIDKEIDWTSRDVCNKICHMIHADKVGHTGTLDPFATGLLLVSINQATKTLNYIEDKDKEYVAELKLGVETSTGDLTGEVKNNAAVPSLSIDEVKNALSSFVGKIKQIPPMTSARHYNGQKLYALAYQGIEVEREPIEVEIKDIELLSFKDNVIQFRAEVSRGTYIRVLGEDIAKKLHTVGHLISLRRTAIGDFKINDKCRKVSEVTEEDIVDISEVMSKYLPIINIDDSLIKDVRSGKPLFKDEVFTNDVIIIKDKTGDTMAIYGKNDDGYYHCLRGMWKCE